MAKHLKPGDNVIVGNMRDGDLSKRYTVVAILPAEPEPVLLVDVVRQYSPRAERVFMLASQWPGA
jgi:hypothetical protein